MVTFDIILCEPFFLARNSTFWKYTMLTLRKNDALYPTVISSPIMEFYDWSGFSIAWWKMAEKVPFAGKKRELIQVPNTNTHMIHSPRYKSILRTTNLSPRWTFSVSISSAWQICHTGRLRCILRIPHCDIALGAIAQHGHMTAQSCPRMMNEIEMQVWWVQASLLTIACFELLISKCRVLTLKMLA